MMKRWLNRLSTIPSTVATRRGVIVGLVGTLVMYPIIIILYQGSGDTVNFLASQLSFSGAFIKAEFGMIIAAGGMGAYVTAQSLDYLLMAFYALLFFTLSLSIGRKFPEGTRWRAISLHVAVLALVVAILDVIENVLIFSMAADPLTFPDVLATAYSGFALAKWLLLLEVIACDIFAAVLLRVNRRALTKYT